MSLKGFNGVFQALFEVEAYDNYCNFSCLQQFSLQLSCRLVCYLLPRRKAVEYLIVVTVLSFIVIL